MKKRLTLAVLVLTLLGAPIVAAEIPRQAPELAIHLTDGKQVLLSQYKGKVVVMAFILTYCSHCQKTVGFLSKYQNDFGPQGLQVLASAIEEGAAAAVPGFLKARTPPFPVGYNELKVALDFLQHPSAVILKMPGLAFIDRQGVIRAQYEGGDPFLDETQMEMNLHDKIVEMLKPAGKTSKKSGSVKTPTNVKKPS